MGFADPHLIWQRASELVSFPTDGVLALSERLPHRMVLYPLGDGFTAEQFSAVSSAAEAVGDPVMYLYAIDRLAREDVSQDFAIHLADFNSYLEMLPEGRDHALLSPRGTWIAVALHDGVGALASSSKAFVEAVSHGLAWPPDSQAVAFLADFTEVGTDAVAGWATRFLDGVLGPRARDIARAYRG